MAGSGLRALSPTDARLADRRESGDRENTADSMLGLYREEIDHPATKERGLAELSVLTNGQLLLTTAGVNASGGVC